MMAAVASAAFLFWLIVPGEAVQEYWNYGDGPTGSGRALAFVDYEHGWPLVYLFRASKEYGRWSFRDGLVEFSARALAVDVAISVLIVGALGIAFAYFQQLENRCLRLLLPGLVILVLLAVATGWWQILAAGRRAEEPLAERIKLVGGSVERTFVGPVWLRKLVGRDGLAPTQHVVSVYLDTDADGFNWQTGETINPEQVRSIIEELPIFTDCRHLTLVLPHLTDKELTILERMPHLESLNLSRSKITDEGLRHLEALSRLKSLDMAKVSLSDAGMQSVGAIKSLERLNLFGTPITDNGLETIGRLPHLQDLSLEETRVSDKGLRHLFGLKNLGILDVRDTQVTEEGVRTVKDLMPDVWVHH